MAGCRQLTLPGALPSPTHHRCPHGGTRKALLSLQLLAGRWDISQLQTKWECSIKTQGGACGNAALGAAPSQPCPSQKEGGTKYSPSVPWEHAQTSPACISLARPAAVCVPRKPPPPVRPPGWILPSFAALQTNLGTLTAQQPELLWCPCGLFFLRLQPEGLRHPETSNPGAERRIPHRSPSCTKGMLSSG